MSDITARPSTMDGIKRLAKTIKRERGTPHHLALDLASQQAGFQNIRHAQHQLAQQSSATYAVYLTAYWAARDGAGRETLRIELPKPLTDIVARHQVSAARNLGWFRLESADHLERQTDVDSQELARNQILAAARTLRFMAATGLRPTTTKKQDRPMGIFRNLPGRDHMSNWFDNDTGVWVHLDEPYQHVDPEQRRKWAMNNGIQLITSQWEGLYNPGSTTPYIFCAEPALANRLLTRLLQIHAAPQESEWNGESASYFSHFEGPSRQAAGTPRRPRPMPAPRGIERNGALPYGSRNGGQTSRWRPAKRMSLDKHLTVGPLLHALDNDRCPGQQRKTVAHVRTTLDNWLQMEYPGDEMTSEQFHEAYYGAHREPIVDLVEQAEAISRVAALLTQGYSDCKPRQRLLDALSKAEAALVKSTRRRSA
jgi:hypothetical protein